MAGTIVVGIDASEAAADALRWAVEEGRLRQATVVAVHAWEMPPAALEPTDIMGAPMRMDIPALMDELSADAEQLARTLVADVVGDDPSVAIEPVAVEASAADALVDVARERGAMLVVVGSRGHGAIVGALLGSVSAHVVRHAPCPVLVHRETALA